MADLPAVTVVLASASPRRAELLRRLGVEPAVRPADLDESPRRDESPQDLVTRLALAKATAIADPDRTDEVVIAADTEVVLDGRSLGKPRDDLDATAMLRSLAGRTHEVITGLAVRRGRRGEHDVITTRVTFRELTDVEIAGYVATGEPQGKAGGYALQGAAAAFVDRLEGSDTNVVGLPLAQTVLLLRQLGVELTELRG